MARKKQFLIDRVITYKMKDKMEPTKLCDVGWTQDVMGMEKCCKLRKIIELLDELNKGTYTMKA